MSDLMLTQAEVVRGFRKIAEGNAQAYGEAGYPFSVAWEGGTTREYLGAPAVTHEGGERRIHALARDAGVCLTVAEWQDIRAGAVRGWSIGLGLRAADRGLAVAALDAEVAS